MIPLNLFSIALPPHVWQQLPHERPLAELAKDAEGAARRIRKGSNARRERMRFAQLSSYIESAALEMARQSREKPEAGRADGVSLQGIRLLKHTDSVSHSSVQEYAEVMERFQNALRRGSLDDEGSSPWPNIAPMKACRFFLSAFCLNIHPAWLGLFKRQEAKLALRRIRLAWESYRESCQTIEGVQTNQECSLLIGRTCHPPGQILVAKRRLFERLTALNLSEMKLFRGLSEEVMHRVVAVLSEKARFYRAAEVQKAAVVEVLAAK